MPLAGKRSASDEAVTPRGQAPAVVPIQWWASVGAVVVIFIVYVLGRWITGPYFVQVPTGPTPLPEWMKIVLVAWQIALPVAWMTLLLRCVVRPWRSDRRVTTDGVLFLAGTTLFFQDAYSSYFNHWITYNSYLLNRGSWVNDIPGWMAYGQPGSMLVEPILIPFLHGCVWLVISVLGSWVIRVCRARWTSLGFPALVAIVFVAMFLFDLVLEGLILLPTGIYTYVGGHAPALFPDSYHKFPLHEALFMGTWSTALAFLYHFRNDKGQMWMERGLDKVRGGTLKVAAVRILAVIGVLHVGVLLFYTVPQTALFTSKSTGWPRDLQERSYLTDGLCGAGTPWACPGPGIPLNRGDGRDQSSISIDPNGDTVVPRTVELPRETPFATQPKGPFTGGIFGQ